jgi:hypothetical protein
VADISGHAGALRWSSQEEMTMGDVKEATAANPLVAWGIALCPFIAVAGFFWIVIGTSGGRFSWSIDVTNWMIIFAVGAGFVGGISLSRSRHNAWWLLVVLASVGAAFMELQLLAAIGLGRMH